MQRWSEGHALGWAQTRRQRVGSSYGPAVRKQSPMEPANCGVSGQASVGTTSGTHGAAQIPRRSVAWGMDAQVEPSAQSRSQVQGHPLLRGQSAGPASPS